MLSSRPKLRDFQVAAYQEDGRTFAHLRDPQGITEDLFVPAELWPLLSLFDGTRTVPEVLDEVVMSDGTGLPRHVLENILQQADELHLLESPRFEAHRLELLRSFAQSGTRPAAFAGLSYPGDEDGLRDFLRDKWEQAAQYDDGKPLPGTLRGIVVPHIDFHRGGVEEALAWRVLNREPFDVLIALGIAHKGVRYPFCATLKDHDTPLGTAKCDQEFVQALRERVGDRLLREEAAHRQEHSLEFVAVFQRFCDNLKDALLVPILCGGFWNALRTGASPAQDEEVAQFCAALRELVREREAKGQRVALVASVDGAHVGSQFGDTTKLTKARLNEIRAQDLEFWHLVEAGDKEAMHAHIAADQNARNVDAHPAVYTLLHALPELRAQLLRYHQAYSSRDNIVVTFGSLALYASQPS